MPPQHEEVRRTFTRTPTFSDQAIDRAASFLRTTAARPGAIARDRLETFEPVETGPRSIVSEDTGVIVRSLRTFGIEYEANFSWANASSLRALIGEAYGIVHDGSVRNGLEVVSPILGGAAGEKEVHKVCKAMTGLQGKVDETCGLHVHFGARDFLRKPKSEVWTLAHAIKFISENPNSSHSYTILHNSIFKSIKTLNPRTFQNIIDKRPINFYDTEELVSEALDTAASALSPAVVKIEKIIRMPRMNFAFSMKAYRALKTTEQDKRGYLNSIQQKEVVDNFSGETKLFPSYGAVLVDPVHCANLRVLVQKRDKNEQNNLERLKRLTAFYTLFDDVIMSMLPWDRRANDFSHRAGHRIAFEDILSARSTLDLLKQWHKFHRDEQVTEASRSNRPRARYCGVNLYALLNQGTIEIRYLGGSLDPNHILHWVNLHHTIIDAAADLDNPRLSIRSLQKAAMIVDQSRRTALFFKKLRLESETADYWRTEIEKHKDDDELMLSECVEEDLTPPPDRDEISISDRDFLEDAMRDLEDFSETT